jgi:hypothetical protein
MKEMRCARFRWVWPLWDDAETPGRQGLSRAGWWVGSEGKELLDQRRSCRPWLVRELELQEPRLRAVVVLGAFGGGRR